MNLYLVTTPIGNLEDFTPRAKDCLIKADLILAEDTRKTKSLLDLAGIKFSDKRIVSFHDHKQDQLSFYTGLIESHQQACIVSDAGSPVLSDPAFPLVREVISKGGTIYSVSGISAVTAALELSGLPPQPFTFHGFIGRKNNENKTKFELCNVQGGTHIFFESPHRIESTLGLLSEEHPDIDVAVVREISKKFETVHRFMAKDLSKQEINYKGEFVLVLNFDQGKQSSTSNVEIKKLAEGYMSKTSSKNLAKLIAAITEEKVSDVYSQLNR